MSVDPSATGLRYHSAAFIISCIVVCYMAAQLLWLMPSANQLATMTLASYYALIRMIQLIIMRKPNHLPLHLHGALVIFDQIYLGVMAFTGLPLYLTLPLSGTLLFMTKSLGVNYLFIALPAAFGSILFALSNITELHLNMLTITVVSLILVIAASLNSLIPIVMAAISKHKTLNNCNSPQHETQGSAPSRHYTCSYTPSIEEKSGVRILIISTDDNRLTSLSEHLSNWGYDYTISRNSVQAFRHMLSRYQANRFVSYTTVIVDQQGLDLDPISLAQLIQNESKLKGLKLICLKAPFTLHRQSQEFYQAGYKALLDNPLNKAQLFSALHEEQQHYPASENVISLSKHRTSKKSKARKGIILLADAASSERTNLSEALIQAGYLIHMVDDGNKALNALEEKPIRLAIVNLKLPIMSGTQILKLHRFTTPYKQWVPFAFLSDVNDTDTLRLCRSVGVQACLFKPVAVKDLLEILPSLLTQHQATDKNINSNLKSPSDDNVTQFQNTGLLDHMTLLRLERLDSGIAFINDLFKIFEAEGSVIIRTMRQAVETRRFDLFLGQAQVLLDSAGQLGAFALYELNRNATRLRAYEFEQQGHATLEKIEKTFNLTLKAYTHYLSQRAASLQKDSI
jgi:DNA-binding response OmpR family regulator